MARTQGSRILLADGRELIDGIASWWTACHGYNHPHIRAAVVGQLARMPHIMFGGLVHEPALTLARRLTALLPEGLDPCLFLRQRFGRGRGRHEDGGAILAQSGRLASEAALLRSKAAIMATHLRPCRSAIPRKGCTAFSRTSCRSKSSPIFQLIPDRAQAFDALLERTAKNLAGIIVEPLVQGAGGMLFHEAQVLRHLRAAADRHGLLLIFDEVFTGFGRTGTMFACEAAGVTPDIITLSKALTGGTIGLGATIATGQSV